ncbi:MAG: oxidoreductase [Desulfuromonas sp.]|nr:MAG: oxidoreductase [Desulfuromonas sp.]
MESTHTKTIVVTGASRGIGELTVKSLAKGGHKVFAAMRDITGRNAETARILQEWAGQNELSISVVELDVTSRESIINAIDTIENQGPIDVLVNNAGIMPAGITEAFSIDQVKATFDVNMFGLAEVSQAVLPGMRKRRQGLIIHISSAAGRLAIPYFGVYCASKWAMEAYAECLNYELVPFNIQSVLVEPSGHATDLVNSAPSPELSAVLEEYGPHSSGREKLLGMFLDLFAQKQVANDAQNVADKIVELVKKEGQLPLRTQVGDDMGVSAINHATAPIQENLIGQLSPIYASQSQ